MHPIYISMIVILLAGIIILGICLGNRYDDIDDLKTGLENVREERDAKQARYEMCKLAIEIPLLDQSPIPKSDLEDKILQLRRLSQRHHDECVEWRKLWHQTLLPALGLSEAVEILRDQVIAQIKALVEGAKHSRTREKELLNLPKSIATENAKLSAEIDSLRYQLHEVSRSHAFSSEIIFKLEKLGLGEEFGYDGIPKDVERLVEHCQLMESRVLLLERQLAAAVRRDSVTGRYLKTG